MPDLTNSELILLAKDNGFPITEGQLDDWRAAGIFPKGSRPGRGQGPGRRRRFYDQSSARHLLALYEIHRTVHPLADVGRLLWWRGFLVEENVWRDVFLRHAELLDKYLPEIRARLLTSNSAELTEVGFNVVHTIKESPIKTKMLRQLRKRLSLSEIETFLKCIFRISGGIPPLPISSEKPSDSEKQSDENIVKKGLGLQRVSIDRFPGAQPLYEGSVSGPLADLANSLANRNASKLIKNTFQNL